MTGLSRFVITLDGKSFWLAKFGAGGFAELPGVAVQSIQRVDVQNFGPNVDKFITNLQRVAAQDPGVI